MEDIQKNVYDRNPKVIKIIILVGNTKQEYNMNSIGIISVFSKVMKKHIDRIHDLQKEIRDYLKIDIER